MNLSNKTNQDLLEYLRKKESKPKVRCFDVIYSVEAVPSFAYRVSIAQMQIDEHQMASWRPYIDAWKFSPKDKENDPRYSRRVVHHVREVESFLPGQDDPESLQIATEVMLSYLEKERILFAHAAVFHCRMSSVISGAQQWMISPIVGYDLIDSEYVGQHCQEILWSHGFVIGISSTSNIRDLDNEAKVTTDNLIAMIRFMKPQNVENKMIEMASRLFGEVWLGLAFYLDDAFKHHRRQQKAEVLLEFAEHHVLNHEPG